MPINIPKDLPAGEILREEKVFVMEEDRAKSQDIRPLKILILNLMPEKEKTELQLLRLLGNTPIQVDITFLRTSTYQSKNVSSYHLDHFYTTFDKVKQRRFDGMIITGAPVEKMAFEEVDYWKELTEIMEWSNENVTSTLHICWGAQAALYYHYGIDKFELPKNVSVFIATMSLIRKRSLSVALMRSFMRHSRYTDVSRKAIEENPHLKLLSVSEEGAPFIIMSENGRNIMVTGHLEYDATTLADEYIRDRKKGLDTDIPKNYFPNNDVNERPLHTWRSHGYLLFSNWLNYYVYQETPYIW